MYLMLLIRARGSQVNVTIRPSLIHTWGKDKHRSTYDGSKRSVSGYTSNSATTINTRSKYKKLTAVLVCGSLILVIVHVWFNVYYTNTTMWFGVEGSTWL